MAYRRVTLVARDRWNDDESYAAVITGTDGSRSLSMKVEDDLIPAGFAYVFPGEILDDLTDAIATT